MESKNKNIVKSLLLSSIALGLFVTANNVPAHASAGSNVTSEKVTNNQKTITIQFGDTVSEYAVQYNSTVKDIAELNHLENANVIYAGNKIVIPVNSRKAGQSIYDGWNAPVQGTGNVQAQPVAAQTVATTAATASVTPVQTPVAQPSVAQAVTPAPTASEAPAASVVVSNAPVNQAPASQTPASQAPASQDPASQTPASQAPASQAPASQTPVSQAPASQAPASQAPASQAPASQTPASQAPASQAPASQTPASQTPASQAPASQTPTSQTPASETPASQAPASQTPASQAPASQEPVSQALASQTSSDDLFLQSVSEMQKKQLSQADEINAYYNDLKRQREEKDNANKKPAVNVYYQHKVSEELPTTDGTVNGTTYWPSTMTIDGVKQPVIVSTGWAKHGLAFDVHTSKPTTRDYGFALWTDGDKYIGSKDLDTIDKSLML